MNIYASLLEFIRWWNHNQITGMLFGEQGVLRNDYLQITWNFRMEDGFWGLLNRSEQISLNNLILKKHFLLLPHQWNLGTFQSKTPEHQNYAKIKISWKFRQKLWIIPLEIPVLALKVSPPKTQLKSKVDRATNQKPKTPNWHINSLRFVTHKSATIKKSLITRKKQ